MSKDHANLFTVTITELATNTVETHFAETEDEVDEIVRRFARRFPSFSLTHSVVSVANDKPKNPHIGQSRPADLIFPEKKLLKDAGRCPICTKPVGNFRDDLSRREYEISGMCQDCQDEVFL